MAHLSATLSSPNAGLLQVVLTGVYFYNYRRDAGFPSGDGADGRWFNYSVRGFVGPVGQRIYTQPIDRYAPAVVAFVQYPGGGVVWPFGTEFVAKQEIGGSGLYTHGIADLKMTLSLAAVR